MFSIYFYDNPFKKLLSQFIQHNRHDKQDS